VEKVAVISDAPVMGSAVSVGACVIDVSCSLWNRYAWPNSSNLICLSCTPWASRRFTVASTMAGDPQT